MKRVFSVYFAAMVIAYSAHAGAAPTKYTTDIFQSPTVNSVQPASTVERKMSAPIDDAQCRADQMHKKNATFEEAAAIGPNAAALWPGSLVQGKSVETGVLTAIPWPSGKKIRLSVLHVPGYRTITPTAANADSAYIDIIKHAPKASPAAISSTAREVFSAEDARLALDLKVNYLGGGVEASIKNSRSKSSRTFVFRFFQRVYDLSVDPDSLSGLKASKDLSWLPEGLDRNTNPLAYVATVSYGRQIVMTTTVSATSSVTEATMSAYAAWLTGSASVAASAEFTKLASESSSELFILGGTAEQAGRILGTAPEKQREAIGKMLGEATVYAPISYRVNFLDHSVMRLGSSAEFTIPSYSPRPHANGWVVDFNTSEDKDDDTALEVYLIRRSSGQIVSSYIQPGKEKFPNNSFAQKGLSQTADIPLSDTSQYELKVCARPNGNDHWIASGLLHASSSGGAPFQVPFQFDRNMHDSRTECQVYPLPVGGPACVN